MDTNTCLACTTVVVQMMHCLCMRKCTTLWLSLAQVYLVDSSHHQEAVSDDDGGGGASGEGHGSQPLPLLSLRMKGLHRVQG